MIRSERSDDGLAGLEEEQDANNEVTSQLVEIMATGGTSESSEALEAQKGSVETETPANPTLATDSDISNTNENETTNHAAGLQDQVPQEGEPNNENTTTTRQEEVAVANYLRMRTEGSPFFESNPAAALPVFDTDGTFDWFGFDSILYAISCRIAS